VNVKVLVTGSAGFLGRHVTRYFADQGWEVTGFDQVDHDEGKTIVGDLTSPDSIGAAVAGNDVVIHIGAIGDVYLAGDQPALAAAVNVVGTANVVEAAVANGSRVVYASTWEVYGHPRYEPIDEDHPTNPDHPYNITKLAGESMLLAACRLRNLSGLALRLGTAFGTGLRPNSVFRIFIDRARQKEPITVQGNGSQGRQFTHARDIARAFELAARSDLSATAINVVAPETVTIRELAEHIVERFPTELRFGPPRPGDVPPAQVSADRALNLLGWEATMPFHQGLDELIDDVLRED
jgi:UDP-glucose 4-epimerase